MESLQSALISTCPAQFTGQSGASFMQAVLGLVASHCMLADEKKWPKDRADDILNKGVTTFDFIVVGGGTAGSIVAARLSEQRQLNVLLIEAGDDPNLDSSVPAYLFSLHNTEQDWKYRSEPDENYCRSVENQSCIFTKGRGMGGSSAINAMMYVRGNRQDFDDWAELGINGWSYIEIEKYFKKIEKINDTYYKNDGYLNIEKFQAVNPLTGSVLKAWNEIGFKSNDNFNGVTQIGVGKVYSTSKDGTRTNNAKVVLDIAKDRDNLYVLKNTHVINVILDQDKQCRGVRVKHNSGRIIDFLATKEVILSAGSVSTPQILMLSGIGIKEDLEKLDIDVKVDLKVGKNLQDHFMYPVYLEIDEKHSMEMSNEMLFQFLIQYMMAKSGPLATIGLTDLVAFTDTDNQSEIPNIQYVHIHIPKKDRTILPLYKAATKFNEDMLNIFDEINSEHDVIAIYPILLRPKSLGEVKLKSSDYNDTILIYPNYLMESSDVKALIKGKDNILKLLDTEEFKSLGVKLRRFDLKNCKHTEFLTDEYWECYIRNIATTIYHPVGTAKMGSANDPDAVVDEELKVYGVNGLRVIDASVMPLISRGNTLAPVMAIAEKGSDIIKTFWMNRNTHTDEL